jgi:hypothetical protein
LSGRRLQGFSQAAAACARLSFSRPAEHHFINAVTSENELPEFDCVLEPGRDGKWPCLSKYHRGLRQGKNQQ